MTDFGSAAPALVARIRAWSSGSTGSGRRRVVWLLLAVPAGVLAGLVARGVSWSLAMVEAFSLPGPLAVVPGLLFLLLVLLARATDAVARPASEELWWFVMFAGVFSPFAFV